jgi:signal transduction histidine kinase
MDKILVIDDDEVLREMVKVALRERGHEVIEANDGATGIALARSELPDLILCDVIMDRVDGYLTLSTLRNDPATASIPFILITGMADTPGMRHGMELGADDYLPKPFTFEGLYAAVDARLKKAKAAREELSSLRDNISLMLPHEMRTPMNGIMGYAELLQASADTLQPEEISEMGQTIYESAKRLERLVENYLAYVALEMAASDPAQAALLRGRAAAEGRRVVMEQAQQAASAAGREGDLQLSLPDLVVPLSETNLAKLVSELVQNAFKFSSAGTPVSLSLLETTGGMALVINDRGRGMTVEQIARIGAYVQFERKSHEQQGAGLGLIIAKRITMLYGGRLDVVSNAVQGTTVTAAFLNR